MEMQNKGQGFSARLEFFIINAFFISSQNQSHYILLLSHFLKKFFNLKAQKTPDSC